jgi:hypothetical protein
MKSGVRNGVKEIFGFMALLRVPSHCSLFFPAGEKIADHNFIVTVAYCYALWT